MVYFAHCFSDGFIYSDIILKRSERTFTTIFFADQFEGFDNS